MPSELPRLTVRLRSELKDKIEYIASSNAASVNSEVVKAIQKHILDYERKNGEIDLKRK